MSKEIERKFLLTTNPDQLMKQGKQLTILSEQVIDQTYIAIHEEQELRVRKIEDKSSGEVTYTHTFKQGHGLVREEVEYSISGGIYEQVTKACGYVPLVKTRITANWEGRIIEIDHYHQLELTVLEIEFKTEEEALQFVPPSWFGEDISTNRQFSNKKVWSDLQRNRNSRASHI